MELVRALGLTKAVEESTEAPLDVLEAAIAKCSVAICLRWPTAGEVSAVLMRALGAGKPVIVSDVPQYRDLDPLFCWRVPIDTVDETSELERLMKTAIEDHDVVRTAGAAAAVLYPGRGNSARHSGEVPRANHRVPPCHQGIFTNKTQRLKD